MNALDRLIAGYYRMGNWLLPQVRADSVLRQLPLVKWGPQSVHLALGGGETLALFGGLGAPETAAQKLIKHLWRFNPLMTDFAGSTADCHVYGQNGSSNYNAARSTGSIMQSLNGNRVGQTVFSTMYTVYRSFWKFDTSSITVANVVTQANLKFVCITDDSSTDFDVQIVKQNWSAQEPVASNIDAIFDNCLTADADLSIWRNTSGIALNTAYTSGNLSTDWIATAGNTYYSLRSSRDLAATTPTTNEAVTLGSTDHTTAAYRPMLVILYIPVSSGMARAPFFGHW